MVVYLHGLWLNGWEAALLRRRLARALDTEAHSFGYSSVTRTLADNAQALRLRLGMLQTDRLDLIAHSLGGLIVLKVFESGLRLPPGRVVFLGSPVCGCRSARRLVRLPLGRRVLGATARESLLPSGEPRWNAARELGVIAGDRGLGLGRLLGPMRRPNDGTVLVEETLLPGAKQRLVLPVSHSGMVFSAVVARQAAAFLREGRFETAGI